MKRIKIDALFDYTKEKFNHFKDLRGLNKQYGMGDIVQSGLAMYSLKDSSLLEFTKRINERSSNLKRIFKINNCPPDSEMREVIDQILPIQIERVKKGVLQKIKESGLFEELEYIDGYKLLLIDGVHHFSSKKVNCQNCTTKNHEDGSVSYSHSMLSAVIAHPEKKVVIPLCEEPIIQQDGVDKNDCELNASKRLLKKVRTRHGDEKFIRVEDALYANGPHIQAICTKGDHYIIRVKPGSGAGSVIKQYEELLTQEVNGGKQDERYKSHKLYKKHGIRKPMTPLPLLQKRIDKTNKIIKEYHFVNGLYLNETHQDIIVNFVHYEERSIQTGKVIKRFQWITDIEINKTSVVKIVKSGRCRWKIENETFNTLKNQGYHFNHNFGHGEQYLCTNFALLMMLAFLIDQVQQLCNEVFQQALKKSEWKKYLWDDVRSMFRLLPFDSMEMIYKAIIHGVKSDFLAIPPNSS